MRLPEGARPVSLGQDGPDVLTVAWSHGHAGRHRVRDLRLACRCAHCIEETSGRPLLEPSTVPENVRAKGIELIGQYAISIDWSDGHSSGIYNFRDLRAKCPCPECTAGRTP